MSYFVTLVANRDATALTQSAIDRVRHAVTGGPPSILSEGEAAEFQTTGAPDLDAARQALGGAAIDVLATRARGRRRGLLVADMDSTIVAGETLDELAEEAGMGDTIAAITLRSMNGDLDFQQALRQRVAMLKGLDLAALDRTWARTKLTPGAQTLVATMRKHGAMTALVSGGFTYFTAKLAALCGFDHHRANTLLDDGKTLTGEVAEPILDRGAKLQTLRDLAALRGVRLSATLAVGDGANDLDMLKEAGLGIAYHAKPIVTQVIPNRLDHANLRALLFAQGYPASVFVGD